MSISVLPQTATPKATTSRNSNYSDDFGSNTYDPRFTLNSVLISKDLSSLSPSEIKDYTGLTELESEEIHSVLCMLTPGNLTKVLMNISLPDLKFIKAKLDTPEIPTFENILNSLSEDNRNRILNRAATYY